MPERYGPLRRLTAVGVAVILLTACGGGGGHSPAPIVTPAPTPTPTTAPANTAYTCPSSDTVAARQSVPGMIAAEGSRRMQPRTGRGASGAPAATQFVAVNYRAAAIGSNRGPLSARESTLGATFVHEYTFSHTGIVTRVLSVPAARVAQVEAAFASQPGVKSVGLTGQRRSTTSVTAPAFTNDPYFVGFPITATSGGITPPPTYAQLPLVESADVPGQWDMHVIRLEYAFGYSLANNSGNVPQQPNALGSASVKMAVIDTGQDTSHPELASKIAYQKCFITNSAGVQSTSNFTTDEDGHGTDVTGIAGAATNNSFGFASAGGNSTIYAYRVFPTPDDNCAQENSTDNQCGADGRDIASAIEDAVAQHVNVISMSLGGGTCSANGVDSDAAEGSAVAEAIAANIVVVAAAGNSTGPPVQAPGCDTGVIAVGATGLADGVANGSGVSGGTPTAPLEYVASYSDNGSPGAIPNSASAWGIVAPGGDPTSGNDVDNLHWVENIWTSTPFDNKNFGGDCEGDYPNLTGTIDCRILIAGTSMATPHVAGAAALILAVAPQYQSSALMKQLLCSTADDIGDAREGCGRLDVYRAMATALNDPVLPSPNPSP